MRFSKEDLRSRGVKARRCVS